MHVINNRTNFPDATVIFEAFDRSSSLFANVLTGFDDRVVAHYSNAVGELDALVNQLKSDATDGSLFLSNELHAIRIDANQNSPGISTFAGVLETVQNLGLCRCKDIFSNMFSTFTLENELHFKREMLLKRLDVIETMCVDVKNEVNRTIATIRDFQQKQESEINAMREYRSQMENNSNVRKTPIAKDIDGPIIGSLIVDCDDYIQVYNKS